jgi:hypothetical protein
VIALRRLVGKRRVSRKDRERLFWLVESVWQAINAATIPASPMMPRYATTDAIPSGANMADERALGLGCPWSKSKGPATGKTGPRGRMEPPPEPLASCRMWWRMAPGPAPWWRRAAAPEGSWRRWAASGLKKEAKNCSWIELTAMLPLHTGPLRKVSISGGAATLGPASNSAAQEGSYDSGMTVLDRPTISGQFLGQFHAHFRGGIFEKHPGPA